jgi:hypothetical protein
MRKFHKSTDLEQIRHLLHTWIANMVIVGFEYGAGFRLRLEATDTEYTRGHMIPSVAILDLKAPWWIGDREEWEVFLADLPLKSRRGEPDEPGHAYRLMLMVGATIQSVTLAADGSLATATSDGEELYVEGKSDIWEESWLIEAPPDLPESGQWSIVCLSGGELSAQWFLLDEPSNEPGS